MRHVRSGKNTRDTDTRGYNGLNTASDGDLDAAASAAALPNPVR